MTGRRLHDGPSCTTILVVRDPVAKGLSFFLSVLQRTHATDRCIYDGPSCLTDMTARDPSPKDLYILTQVSYDVIYDGLSYL